MKTEGRIGCVGVRRNDPRCCQLTRTDRACNARSFLFTLRYTATAKRRQPLFAEVAASRREVRRSGIDSICCRDNRDSARGCSSYRRRRGYVLPICTSPRRLAKSYGTRKSKECTETPGCWLLALGLGFVRIVHKNDVLSNDVEISFK